MPGSPFAELDPDFGALPVHQTGLRGGPRGPKGGGVRAPEGPAPAMPFGYQPLAPAIGGRSPLFDVARKTLERDWPSTPQVSHEETEPRWARGTPEWMLDQKLTGKKNLGAMRAHYEAGQEAGAGVWYNTKQLLDRFIGEWGAEEGPKRFREYLDMVTATSPQNKVPMNIRDASYRYGRWVQGEPPPAKEWKPAEGYGSKVQQLHNQNVRTIMEQGGLDPIKNPKPFRFVENLMGNLEPVTVDSWAMRGANVRDKSGRGMEVPRDAYHHVADVYRRLAEEYGVPPANVQAPVWASVKGEWEKTPPAGDPFLKLFQDRVMHTAAKRGLPPEVVLRRMVRGEEPLLSVTGGRGSIPAFIADAWHGTDRGLKGGRFSQDEINRTWHDNDRFAGMHIEDPEGGVWLTNNREEAGDYAKSAMRLNRGDPGQTGANVIPAQVRFQNPYMHPAKEIANEGISSVPSLYDLEKRGYDGVVIPRNADWKTKPEMERTDAQLRAMSKPEFEDWVRNHLHVDPGTLEHYAALKPGTVFSKLTGEQLFAKSGLPMPTVSDNNPFASAEEDFR